MIFYALDLEAKDSPRGGQHGADGIYSDSNIRSSKNQPLPPSHLHHGVQLSQQPACLCHEFWCQPVENQQFPEEQQRCPKPLLHAEGQCRSDSSQDHVLPFQQDRADYPLHAGRLVQIQPEQLQGIRVISEKRRATEERHHPADAG